MDGWSPYPSPAPAIPQIQYLLAPDLKPRLSVCFSNPPEFRPPPRSFSPLLPFQTADKGQIIIDRVELSRFELKRRALPSLSRLIPIYPCGSCLK